MVSPTIKQVPKAVDVSGAHNASISVRSGRFYRGLNPEAAYSGVQSYWNCYGNGGNVFNSTLSPPPAAWWSTQTWTTMGVLINMLGQGMTLSFPSVLVPGLLSPDSKIKSDLHIASWVASCTAFAISPGFLISSILMDRYGRKLAHLVQIIPGIIGWIFIFNAANIPMLVIGRLLCGYSVGSTTVLGALVIGEYTSPRNRGMFLNLKTSAVCLGNITVHISGRFLQWQHVAIVAMVPHVVAFLMNMTWPESPAWLASKERFELCEKSFYWLRGTSDRSEAELQALIRARKERTDCTVPTSMAEKVSEVFKKFKKRDFVKPLIIMFFCLLLLETCGRHTFPSYAFQIIGEISGSETHSFYYIMAIDFIILTSTLFSSFLVRVMKRRTLLLGTGFAALFVLACVCLYLYLTTKGVVSAKVTWISPMLFCVFFILSNLGCTPIPLALLGELFPLGHRAVGAAVSGIMLGVLGAICTKVTPHLLVSIKVYGTFAVFGSAMGLSLTVLCFILPETKDRTLQEIEDYFNYGTFKIASIDDDEAKTNMISRPY